MASIITGVFTPKSPRLNNLAAAIDFAGCVTLLVIGVLGALHMHGYHIATPGAITMIGMGAGGLAILAMKKIQTGEETAGIERKPLAFLSFLSSCNRRERKQYS